MKKVFYLGLLLLATLQMKAQVSDISLNLTPTLNYTWWDNQLYIENGPMVGGMIGFGFGPNIEIRGLYERSLDLKSTLNDLKAPQNIIDKFKAREVGVTRWGGEFKANIPTGTGFAPYLTLGSGVQKISIDKVKEEQIYLSGGLGTKFNLGDRLTLNLEGKVHAFNIDPTSMLRIDNPAEDEFNKWIDKNITNERMLNWSLNVGLQFYLGGQNRRNYTALDKALAKQYSGGLSGMRFVFEPGIAYINFDNETNMRDTYLLGGALGFDFNDFLGIRGYYYQSTKDKKISTDFDKMAIYGSDFIAKLNVARGVVPYITLGGGYMNVYDSYVGDMVLQPNKSGYFAKGGVGLTIPISSYFELFGAANLMLTTDKENAADLQSSEDLKKHTMYNAGLKFNIGKKYSARRALDSYVAKRVDDKVLMYEQRIAELKEELDEAYRVNDAEKAAKIMDEKQRVEAEAIAVMSEAKAMGENSTRSNLETELVGKTGNETMIRLTPEELESLVQEVVKGVGAPAKKVETPEERIERLERILLNNNNLQQPMPYHFQPQVATPASQAQEATIGRNIENSTQELLLELRRISDRIEENSRKIDTYNRQASTSGTVVVAPSGQNQVAIPQPQPLTNNVATPSLQKRHKNNVILDKTSGRPTAWVIYQGLSPFLGVNLGERTSAIFGLKGNYGFSSTDFIFSPDLYFGIGGKFAYGINANVTYPIMVNNSSMFTPYVGAGLGLNKVQSFNFGVNLIAGSYIEVGNGSLFVEYTSRRLFKNNLFSLGYRFDF